MGASAAVGINVSQYRAVVQGAGSAMRMPIAVLRKEFDASIALHRGVLRFTHALMGQIAQTAGCNRFHRAEMRLARWLLVTRDRLRSENFHLTHRLPRADDRRAPGRRDRGRGNLAKRKLISCSRGNVAS